MPRARLLLSLAVSAALLAGCGSGAPVAEPAPERDVPAAEETAAAAPDAPAEATPPAADAPAPVASGEALPAGAFDFVLPAVGGGEVVGGDLARTDLALWFWAPW